MSKFNSFIINSPALEALQKLQNNSAVAAAMKVQTSPAFIAAMKLQESSALATAIKIESSPMFAVAKEIQKSLESTKMPLAETAAALIEYRNMIAPLTDAIKQFTLFL